MLQGVRPDRSKAPKKCPTPGRERQFVRLAHVMHHQSPAYVADARFGPRQVPRFNADRW
jgi:hypothetical protein